MLKYLKIIRIIGFVLFSSIIYGQNDQSVLEYSDANVFVSNGEWQRAIVTCNKILVQNPNDIDTRLLLANVYAWSKKYDSSKVELDNILIRQPSNEQALLAYGNVELWSGNFNAALIRVNIGLSFYENSKTFLFQKAKVLENLEKFDQAIEIVDSLVVSEPDNKEYNEMLSMLRMQSKQHKVSVFYLYEYVNAGYLRSAHVFGAEVAIKTKYGFVIPRINIGQLAQTSDEYLKRKSYQLEIDCYPKLTANDYLYLNYGYADTSELLFFPTHRAGIEWFRKLPWKFEASVGARYLYFNHEVFVYTGSVNKYLKSFWFSFRPYISSNKNTSISNSVVFTTRWYFAGNNDYVSLTLNSGFSPDNVTQANGFASSNKLQKYGVGMGVRKQIQLFLFKYNVGLGREEYLSNTYGILWNMDATISYFF